MTCNTTKKVLDFQRASIYAVTVVVVGCVLFRFHVESTSLKVETRSNTFQIQKQPSTNQKSVILTCIDGNKIDRIMFVKNQTQVCFTSDFNMSSWTKFEDLVIMFRLDFYCSNRPEQKKKFFSLLIIIGKGTFWAMSVPLLLCNEDKSIEFCVNVQELKFYSQRHLVCNLPLNEDKILMSLFFKESEQKVLQKKGRKTINKIFRSHLSPLFRRFFYGFRIHPLVHNFLIRKYMTKAYKVTNSKLYRKKCSCIAKLKNIVFSGQGSDSFSEALLSADTTHMFRSKREAVLSGNMADQLKKTTRKVDAENRDKVGDYRRRKFNVTAYHQFLAKKELDRNIQREAEWAYLCLVFVSLFMIWAIWYLRGFHSRNTDQKLVMYSDEEQYLTVKEVMYMKAPYLPMINHQGPLEEVLVHECGINTER